MTIVEELDDAKAQLKRCLTISLDHPDATLWRRKIEDLERMWGDTEFMPLTRATLDGTTQHSVIDIASEIEALITRLHSISIDRAARIAGGLATFRADPTHDNLRRIWIR